MPSSPLHTVATAAATEGSRLARPPSSPVPAWTTRQQPVSIIESANRLVHDRVEEFSAKLMVFWAFCAKFEEAARQFARSGLLDRNPRL